MLSALFTFTKAAPENNAPDQSAIDALQYRVNRLIRQPMGTSKSIFPEPKPGDQVKKQISIRKVVSV